MTTDLHVAVLYGGLSAEREVSLMSGKAVAAALESLGYKVSLIDAKQDVAAQLTQAKPDVVFNALHGRYGEDGTVQGVLEMLAIPYTHSGVLASALAMDKPMAKKVFEAEGLQCAAGSVCSKTAMLQGEPMARPFVIKPLNEGSSVGVSIIHDDADYAFGEADWPFGDQVLVEKYIPGREVQVAVLGEGEGAKALGAIEIRPKQGFYDYEAKYTDGKAEHIMPAPIDANAYGEVLQLAERAHRALGCRGVTRSDFRYDENHGIFYLLETNTQPGMTPLSLTPEIAAHDGMDFATLVKELVRMARLDNDHG